LFVGDVVETEPARRSPGQGDPSAAHVETAHEPPRTSGRVVEREQPEAAADVEDRAGLGQVLTDLVEKALAQDPEPYPAVGAHDRIVVGADDSLNGRAVHRFDSPDRGERDRIAPGARGARGTPPGAPTPPPPT